MNVRIDRLALTLSGIRGIDPRRLAAALGRDLGAIGANLDARTLGEIRVDVAATSTSSIDELSQQIVAQVVRAIARQV